MMKWRLEGGDEHERRIEWMLTAVRHFVATAGTGKRVYD